MNRRGILDTPELDTDSACRTDRFQVLSIFSPIKHATIRRRDFTSEQNPKQNIIRFPLSRLERRQLPAQQRTRVSDETALLRMLCGWALVLGTALFLIANYRIYCRPRCARSAATLQPVFARMTAISPPSTTKTRPSATVRCLNPVWRTRTVTRCSCPCGQHDHAALFTGYSDPAVESSTNYVLVYDRGGVKPHWSAWQALSRS